ncbi:MAG: hypothetical protein ACUZ8E_17795 [Candidatus Anammoxibacter sp.]
MISIPLVNAVVGFYMLFTATTGVIGGEYEGYRPLVQKDAVTASSIH